jgi:hypothetical protein
LAAKVFFSYSHADEALRDQLERQLDILRRQGVIETWNDRRIGAGQDFGHEIDQHLEEADIILLLVSSDFLSSDYCQDIELRRALERNADGTATVIPVILRDCLWQRSPFGRLQATPTNGRAVTQWPDRDQALTEVARAIETAAARFEAPRQESNWRGISHPGGDERRVVLSAAASPGPRSSNLRLAKTFTDRDRDQFLHGAFEFMARFFENSLIELSARNDGIEGDFRRVDANRFTAAIYKNGKAAAKCNIFVGSSFGSGIGFSYGESHSGTSYNENLTVETDDQMLFLRPMGFGMGGERDSKLSEEGAAEFYWSMLISRMQ